jgi:hypothetical protein
VITARSAEEDPGYRADEDPGADLHAACQRAVPDSPGAQRSVPRLEDPRHGHLDLVPGSDPIFGFIMYFHRKRWM